VLRKRRILKIFAREARRGNTFVLLDNICDRCEKFGRQLPSWVTGFAFWGFN
jgi:hypothetical protein